MRTLLVLVTALMIIGWPMTSTAQREQHPQYSCATMQKYVNIYRDKKEKGCKDKRQCNRYDIESRKWKTLLRRYCG